MIVEFDGEAVYWRGPAPFIFAEIDQAGSEAIKSVSRTASYGWGCIPCKARIGNTDYTTALFPKNGLYMVPIKVAVQRAENIEVGTPVKGHIEFDINQYA